MFNDSNRHFDGDVAIQPAVNQPFPEWSRDRFLRIPTQSRYRQPGAEEGIEMPGGYWVSRVLLADAFRMFWRCASNLKATRKHTAKQMCSDPGWEDRPRGQRLAIGRCIKYFEVNQILPITLANAGKRGTRRYLLNANLQPSSNP